MGLLNDPNNRCEPLSNEFSRIEDTLSNRLCSLDYLDSKSFQLLQMLGESSSHKLRKRHESLLINVPEKMASPDSEAVFVQQCYDALPQGLLLHLSGVIRSTEPFAVKSKQLRNLLWDERKTPLVEAFKQLSQQLRG